MPFLSRSRRRTQAARVAAGRMANEMRIQEDVHPESFDDETSRRLRRGRSTTGSRFLRLDDVGNRDSYLLDDAMHRDEQEVEDDSTAGVNVEAYIDSQVSVEGSINSTLSLEENSEEEGGITTNSSNASSSSETVDSSSFEGCLVCGREGDDIDLGHVAIESVRFGVKFCRINKSEVDDPNGLWACGICREYVTKEGKNTSSCAFLVWPAFIAEGLRQKDGRKMWRLLPSNWRVWWKSYVLLELQWQEEDTVQQEVTVEKSHERDEFVYVMSHLSSSSYRRFKSILESTLSVPLVRCPWGCAEFIGRAGTIPLDVFLSGFFGLNKVYSKASLFHCTRGFRRDLLDGTVNILENPEWPCMPTIVQEEGVPFALCCRYHGTSHTMRYLHPPSNPTGSISFPDDNMFAPVVAMPRCVLSFKRKAFSNRYQVNRAIGTYSGLDTVNLATEITVGERTHLGMFRSALCLGGREDYAMFAGRFRDTRCSNSVERASCEHLIDQGIDLKRSGMAAKCAQGSTFIPIMEVYSQLVATKRAGTARVLKLENGEEVPFTARWPRTLARVGIVGDVYGEAVVPYNGCKGVGDQAMWSLLNVIHAVPELWEQVDLNCKSVLSWEGWTLGFLYARTVRTRYGPTSGQCVNPFTSNKCNLAKIREMMQKLEQEVPADPNLSDSSELLTLFSKALRYESILVTENFPNCDRVQMNHSILVVGFNNDGGAAPAIRGSVNGGYVLKAILMHTSLEESKGKKIYYRETFQSKFWIIKGDSSHGSKEERSVQQLLEEESLDKRWGVLVYCRESEPNFEAFKQTMLELNGASHRLKCLSHPECCLVTCPFRRTLTCSKLSCDKRMAWVCPMDDCGYGLCNAHERSENNIALSVSERRRSNTVQQVRNDDRDMEEMIDNNVESAERNDTAEYEDDDYDSDDDSSYDTVGRSYDEELSYDHSSSYSGSSSSGSVKDWEEEEEYDTNIDELDNNSMVSSDSMSKAGSYQNPLDGVADDEYRTYEAEDDHEGFLDEVANRDSDSDGEDLGDIPTTNTGRHIGTFGGLHELRRDGKMIPSHVLLNTEGNLLIRRRRNLGKGTTASRHFLQSLVSTLPGRSVPLAYPEATINPSMFYFGETDGSIAGAIPVSMLQDGKVLASKGVASLYDMYRTRYLDPTLLSSTNHAYQAFCWDAIANLSLRGVSSELFWRRGFLSVPDYNGTCFSVNNEPLYDTHYLDSRTAVNQLAAANARKTCDLFFTFTCNQAQTLGVRNITKWVRSPEAQEQVRRCGRSAGCIIPDDDDNATQVIGRSLEESAGIYMVRAWNEIVQALLKYIQFGRDSPFRNVVCGGVKDIFDRAEIQNELDGKVPHHHVLLFLSRKAETEDDLLSILNLIRGAASTLFTEEEWEFAKENGFVENGDVFMDFIFQAERLLTHYCTTRCLIKVKTRMTDGTYELSKERKCKQPDINKASPSPLVHCLPVVNIDHSDIAIQAMMWMRIICKKRDSETGAEKLVTNDRTSNYLESRKHFPPCPPTVRPMSPANPFLFCMFLSAINLQYCTMYILLRYLTKYVATVDKAVKFQVCAEKEDQNGFKIDSTDDHNTKITGNRIEANQRKYNPCFLEGRNLSMSEMQMQMLKYGMVNTTFSYKQIPTGMMALRPVIKRPSRIQRLKKNGQLNPQNFHIPRDLNVGQVFPCQEARRTLGFENWRMFEKYQVVSYLDSIYQPAALDKITLFGLRPPELRWVDQPKYYITWFEKKRAVVTGCSHDLDKETTELQNILNVELGACPWVDATGTQVVIRASAISKARKYLKNLPDTKAKEYFSPERTRATMRAMDRVLEKLEVSFFGMRLRNHGIGAPDPYVTRFALETPNVSRKYKALPIYWFRPVRSSETEAFLHHLLLSMGRFTTELELLSQGNLKKAFVHAGLLTDSSDPDTREDSVRALANKYNKEQLQFHPMGTRRLGIELHTMQKTLRNFFLEDRIESTSLPSALFTKIRTECLTDIETYCHQTQLRLTQSLLHHLSQIFQSEGDLPEMEQIFPADPTQRVRFDPLVLPRHQDQSELSYEEHYAGYVKAKNMIEHYCRATLERTKSLVLVGGGGVGKSTATRVNALCYLSFGLFLVCTTLMGKRASEFGSEHIHLRMKLPINDRMSVSQRAERAYRSLLKDPKRLEVLRRVDVLLIDELGQLDARTIAVLDLLLKKIRRNTHVFGGIIVLATMDVRQLKPINGMPPLMLPAMQSSFAFHEFKIPLRTTDPDHQRIQQITRMSRTDLGEKGGEIFHEFSRLIRTKCTFKESIMSPDIPKNAIYCFPRRKLAKMAEEKVLERLKETYRDVYKMNKATDSEEMPFASETYRASSVTSQALDRIGKTPKELYFFPWAAYEVTFNDPTGNFAQSQLCLLPEIPTNEVLEERQPIRLLRAPPGVDEIPDTIDEHILTTRYNWKSIHVGEEPEKRHYLGQNGLYGYRDQYGLRHRISCTIHAIMGASASYLVTQISTLEDETMWEAAQVVVLLSRTRCAKNICFIGDPVSTVDALWTALTTKDQFTDFVSGLLASLMSEEPAQFNEVIQNDFPYRPKDWTLPPAGEYCCYMLLSLADKRKTYIGMTSDMGKRLNQHNSRQGGSNVTSRIHLKPWALLGYVTGFVDRIELRDFERIWQKEVEHAQQRQRRNLDPLQRFDVSTTLLVEHTHLKRTLCVYIENQ